MMVRFTKSLFLGVVFALAASAASAVPVDKNAARSVVEGVAGSVISILRQDSAVTSRESQFRAILEQNGDMRRIAGAALGRYGRMMPDSMKSEYVDLFTQHVTRAYAAQFADYSGESVDVTQIMDGGKRGLFVRTEIKRPAGAPIQVDWVLNDNNGAPLITDMYVEGVSLVQYQRDQITSMINARGGDLNAFLADFRAQLGR